MFWKEYFLIDYAISLLLIILSGFLKTLELFLKVFEYIYEF